VAICVPERGRLRYVRYARRRRNDLRGSYRILQKKGVSDQQVPFVRELDFSPPEAGSGIPIPEPT
jgi:hypothetical protein